MWIQEYISKVHGEKFTTDKTTEHRKNVFVDGNSPMLITTKYVAYL